jgi:hypothetical protein
LHSKQTSKQASKTNKQALVGLWNIRAWKNTYDTVAQQCQQIDWYTTHTLAALLIDTTDQTVGSYTRSTIKQHTKAFGAHVANDGFELGLGCEGVTAAVWTLPSFDNLGHRH